MQYAQSHFLAPVADSLAFEERFLYRRNLRQTWHKKGDLDLVLIPPAHNS